MSDLDLDAIKAGLRTDCAYLASAKRDLIALVAEVEKLRAENARLERLLGAEPFPTSDGYEAMAQALADERAKVDTLRALLAEVLDNFPSKPRDLMIRSGYVLEETLIRWRSHLRGGEHHG